MIFRSFIIPPRPRAGHPRLPSATRAWRAGTSPAMAKPRSGRRLRLVAAALALTAATLALPAQGETVLRVAMTAGDIPDWTGQPDQGFEGYRFVGWSPYDALINWDL